MRNFFNRLSQLDNDEDNRDYIPFRRTTRMGMLGQTNPMQNPNVNDEAPVQQVNPALAQINQQYETPILNMYRQHLMNQPNPANYQPSFGRKLLAGLAGLNSNSGAEQYNITRAIQDEPYNRAMEGYSTRAKNLSEGANVEARDIENKRQIAYQSARTDLMNQANEIKREREAFLKDKSNQINEVAWAKIQQQYDALNQRYDYLMQDMARKGANSDELNTIARERIAAANDRHAAEMERRDRLLDELTRSHDILQQRADAYAKYLKDKGLEDPFTTVSTQRDNKGNIVGSITTTKSRTGGGRGQGPGTPNLSGKVRMIAPDGSEKDIPVDQVDHYKSLGAKVK